MMTKEEMLEFCKNGLIPASHIMIHDNETLHLACSLFKVSETLGLLSCFMPTSNNFIRDFSILCFMSLC